MGLKSALNGGYRFGIDTHSNPFLFLHMVLARFNTLIYIDSMSEKKKARTIKEILALPAFDADIFNNDFELFIDQFCKENNIQDFKQENNNIWCACMMYLNKHVIQHINIRDTNYINNNSCIATNYNKYNYDLIHDYILPIYLFNCIKFNKDISIYSFSLLIGCDNDYIYSWQHDEPTSKRFMIWKKLYQGRENCLNNKLSDGKQNPVGIIAILNHSYGYATNASANGLTPKTALTSENLPQLADNSNVID